MIDSLGNAFELGVKEGVIGIARIFIRKQLGEEGNTQEKIISNCTEVLGIPEDLVIKAYELEKNENLEYKDQATHILNNINIKNKDVIKTNKEGKLTKGHIEARAKRYAVTMLLRHYWEACYYYKYNEKPELPYAIQFLGHGDYIGPETEYDSIQ